MTKTMPQMAHFSLTCHYWYSALCIETQVPTVAQKALQRPVCNLAHSILDQSYFSQIWHILVLAQSIFERLRELETERLSK